MRFQQSHFFRNPFRAVFPLRRDYLRKGISSRKILGLVSDAYFIDIGIPEDYQRAQEELVANVG